MEISWLWLKFITNTMMSCLTMVLESAVQKISPEIVFKNYSLKFGQADQSIPKLKTLKTEICLNLSLASTEH